MLKVNILRFDWEILLIRLRFKKLVVICPKSRLKWGGCPGYKSCCNRLCLDLKHWKLYEYLCLAFPALQVSRLFSDSCSAFSFSDFSFFRSSSFRLALSTVVLSSWILLFMSMMESSLLLTSAELSTMRALRLRRLSSWRRVWKIIATITATLTATKKTTSFIFFCCCCCCCSCSHSIDGRLWLGPSAVVKTCRRSLVHPWKNVTSSLPEIRNTNVVVTPALPAEQAGRVDTPASWWQ